MFFSTGRPRILQLNFWNRTPADGLLVNIRFILSSHQRGGGKFSVLLLFLSEETLLSGTLDVVNRYIEERLTQTQAAT